MQRTCFNSNISNLLPGSLRLFLLSLSKRRLSLHFLNASTVCNNPFLGAFLMAEKQTYLNYFGFTSPVVYFLGLDNALPLSLFFFLLLTSNQEQKSTVISQKIQSHSLIFFLHHKILCLFHVHLQWHGLHWELFRTKEQRIKREREKERSWRETNASTCSLLLMDIPSFWVWTKEQQKNKM